MNDNADDIDREIARAHLEASGWNLDDFMQESIFNAHVIYITDLRNNHTQLFSVPRPEFEKRIDLPGEFRIEDLATAISALAEKLPDNLTNAEFTNTFTGALVAYFKMTRTYGAWLTQSTSTARLHAVVLFTRNGNVRPYALQSDKTVLDVDEYRQSVQSVIAADMKKHPEWYT